jgi:hypothetical protein
MPLLGASRSLRSNATLAEDGNHCYLAAQRLEKHGLSARGENGREGGAFRCQPKPKQPVSSRGEHPLTVLLWIAKLASTGPFRTVAREFTAE